MKITYATLSNTGKVRKILSAGGDVLVSNSEIDYDKVNECLEYPEDILK